ncbi:MAG: LCP family protein [Sphaerochaeta sp.]|uniref:LCP family protein n=1 Tax=Sphaerochaeta sp. TaxID=1972642 RepID=UPI00258C9EA2|nr:LCP family protein [Sphaerochaeta sp.]MDD4039351.1 LCP family protein [Sphaerochaeta sp.]
MKNRPLWLRVSAMLLIFLLCVSSVSLAESSSRQTAEAVIAELIDSSDNPLINPACTVLSNAEKISLQPDVINILILGIDDLDKDYTYRTEMAHTDAMMLLSINVDENHKGKIVSMLSFPRDLLAYVPGVKGIYKINGAINCGDALAVGASRADAKDVVGQSETGFSTVCSTVSWMLGGIQIDYYCGITMDAMAALGDLIGGVDFDLEMSYTGHSQKRYTKGFQHLDGTGIVDYFRARKNATSDTGSDEARAGRQREMMLAILDKVVADKSLILKVLDGLQSNDTLKQGFFTNVSATNMMQLVGVGLKLMSSIDVTDADTLNQVFGSYSMDGEYLNAFGNWKFRFIDQANRIKVIQEVFGVEVSELSYVSYPYAKWLYESGFMAVRYLAVADAIRDFIVENHQYESVLSKAVGSGNSSLALSEEQSSSLDTFNASYVETLQAFLTAASAVDTAALNDGSYNENLTTELASACKNLQASGNALAKLVGYPAGVGKKTKKVEWTSGVYMDEDPLINEIYVNFR